MNSSLSTLWGELYSLGKWPLEPIGWCDSESSLSRDFLHRITDLPSKSMLKSETSTKCCEKLLHWLFLVQAGVMVTCWSWIRISKDFHPTGSETQTRQEDPKTVKRRFGPIPSRFSFIVFIIVSFRGPSGHLGGVSLSLQPNHATAARVRASQGLKFWRYVTLLSFPLAEDHVSHTSMSWSRDVMWQT